MKVGWKWERGDGKAGGEGNKESCGCGERWGEEV